MEYRLKFENKQFFKILKIVVLTFYLYHFNTCFYYKQRFFQLSLTAAQLVHELSFICCLRVA